MDAGPGPHATRLTRSLLDLSSPKRGSTLDTRPSSAAAARSTKTDTFLRVHTMIHDKPHNESKCGHGWCGRTRFPLKPENQGRHELHRNSTATNKKCLFKDCLHMPWSSGFSGNLVRTHQPWPHLLSLCGLSWIIVCTQNVGFRARVQRPRSKDSCLKYSLLLVS